MNTKYLKALVLLTGLTAASANAAPLMQTHSCKIAPNQPDLPVGSPDAVEIFLDVTSALHNDPTTPVDAVVTAEFRMEERFFKYSFTGTYVGELLAFPTAKGKFDSKAGAAGDLTLHVDLDIVKGGKATAIVSTSEAATAKTRYDCVDVYSWILNDGGNSQPGGNG